MPDSLNEEQVQVVTYSGTAPLLVVAGPGSGKTSTILNRLLYLLKANQITEDKCAVITFTKAAALELQSRFCQLCKEEHHVYQVFFGTFHSFFYHILLHSGYIKPNHFLTGKEKRKLLEEAIRTVNSKAPLTKERKEYTSQEYNEILERFSLYKNTLDDSSMENRYEVTDYHLVFKQYESLRKSRCAYDYDDLQWDCYQLFLKNQSLLNSWKEFINGLFVDEFQDINTIQYELLKLLYDSHISITVVGDDDQSIYGFRGSSPDWMRQYQNEYSAKQIALKKNYRCSNEIITLATKLIEKNQNRFEKNFVCGKPKERGITQIKGYISAVEQFDTIGKQAQSLKGKKAILFRTNSGLQKAAFILKRKGYWVFSKELREDDFFVETDILNYLRYIYTDDLEAFYAILGKPYRGVSREKFLQSKGKTLDEIIASYRRTDPCSATAVKLSQFKQQCLCAKKLAIGPCLFYICKIMGYETYLEQKAGDQRDLKEVYSEILDFLKSQLLEFKTYEEMLEGYQRRETERKSVDRRGEKIELLTLHSSKGLEFDHVWIPDCNEGILPYGTILNPATNGQTIEEERRLLYVGMTRARLSLELSYIIPSKDSTRKISRFIEEIR